MGLPLGEDVSGRSNLLDDYYAVLIFNVANFGSIKKSGHLYRTSFKCGTFIFKLVLHYEQQYIFNYR